MKSKLNCVFCLSETESGLPHLKRLSPITTHLSVRNHTLNNIQKQFIVLSSGMFIKLSSTSRDSIIMLSELQKDFDTCVYSFSETLGVADIGVGKVELPDNKLVTWGEKDVLRHEYLVPGNMRSNK